MQEEIFGPVLPIITVNSVDEAIEFVNARPKPLALYVFSNSKDTQHKVLHHTSSGGAAINDAILQVICPELPFGGVGPSGMGSYNGDQSFHTFTHRKSVLDRATWPDPSIRYPPYTESKMKWVKFLSGDIRVPKYLILAILSAPIIGFLFLRYYYGQPARL